MEIGDLDQRDRRNLYVGGATNVCVVEIDIDEFADADLPEELETAIDNMVLEIRVRQTKVAYVVIKIVG